MRDQLRFDIPSAGANESLPHLTRTERRLLETLRGRAGQPISREELVRVVLSDPLASGRTVDVHIRALRKKLGPAARILTVRGTGYTWEADPTPPRPEPAPSLPAAPASDNSPPERDFAEASAFLRVETRAALLGGIDRLLGGLVRAMERLLEAKATVAADRIDQAAARYETVLQTLADLVKTSSHPS